MAPTAPTFNPKPIRTLVAARVKRALELCGHTVPIAADLAGISRSHLYDVRAGRRSIGLESLDRLAVVVAMDSCWLVGGPTGVGGVQPPLPSTQRLAHAARRWLKRRRATAPDLARVAGVAARTVYRMIDADADVRVDTVARLELATGVETWRWIEPLACDPVARGLTHTTREARPSPRLDHGSLRRP